MHSVGQHGEWILPLQEVNRSFRPSASDVEGHASEPESSVTDQLSPPIQRESLNRI
jgi:hypothetical protein